MIEKKDKKNISWGLILSYISLFVSLAGSLFVTPIILNNIGDSYYGLYSFCTSITSWLTIASTAVGASYIFFVNKEIKENGSTFKTNGLYFKIFSVLSLVVLAVSFLSFFLLKYSGFRFPNYSEKENEIVFVLLLISGIQVATSVFFSNFRAFNNFKKSFIFVKTTQVIIAIGRYVANLLVAFFSHSVILIAIVALVGAAINGVANLLFALMAKNMEIGLKKNLDDGRTIKNIIAYSSIVLITVIVSNIDSNIDKTLLGIIIDSKSVAIYQLSITFAAHLTVISYSFSEVVQPTIFERYRKGLVKEANDLIIYVSKIQTIVILFIVGGYISCGYNFVKLWIGESRISVFYYSTALFISLIIPLTKTCTLEAFRSNNKQKIPAIISLCSSLFNLLMTYILLKTMPTEHGIWACIIGTASARFLFLSILEPIYASYSLKIPMGKYYANLFKIFLIAFVSAVFAFRIGELFLTYVNSNFLLMIIKGFIFVLFYISLLFVLDRRFLINLTKTAVRTMFGRC